MRYHEQELRQRMVFARVAALTLGAALVLWGAAPAFIERSVTGHPPGVGALAVGSISLLLGASFVALFVLMGSGYRWPQWVAFGLALALVTTTLVVWVSAGAGSVSLFLLILAGSTTIATWMCISYSKAALPRIEHDELVDDPRY